jgi:hypothetical protein
MADIRVCWIHKTRQFVFVMLLDSRHIGPRYACGFPNSIHLRLHNKIMQAASSLRDLCHPVQNACR